MPTLPDDALPVRSGGSVDRALSVWIAQHIARRNAEGEGGGGGADCSPPPSSSSPGSSNGVPVPASSRLSAWWSCPCLATANPGGSSGNAHDHHAASDDVSQEHFVAALAELDRIGCPHPSTGDEPSSSSSSSMPMLSRCLVSACGAFAQWQLGLAASASYRSAEASWWWYAALQSSHRALSDAWRCCVDDGHLHDVDASAAGFVDFESSVDAARSHAAAPPLKHFRPLTDGFRALARRAASASHIGAAWREEVRAALRVAVLVALDVVASAVHQAAVCWGDPERCATLGHVTFALHGFVSALPSDCFVSVDASQRYLGAADTAPFRPVDEVTMPSQPSSTAAAPSASACALHEALRDAERTRAAHQAASVASRESLHATLQSKVAAARARKAAIAATDGGARDIAFITSALWHWCLHPSDSAPSLLSFPHDAALVTADQQRTISRSPRNALLSLPLTASHGLGTALSQVVQQVQGTGTAQLISALRVELCWWAAAAVDCRLPAALRSAGGRRLSLSPMGDGGGPAVRIFVSPPDRILSSGDSCRHRSDHRCVLHLQQADEFRSWAAALASVAELAVTTAEQLAASGVPTTTSSPHRGDGEGNSTVARRPGPSHSDPSPHRTTTAVVVDVGAAAESVLATDRLLECACGALFVLHRIILMLSTTPEPTGDKRQAGIVGNGFAPVGSSFVDDQFRDSLCSTTAQATLRSSMALLQRLHPPDGSSSDDDDEGEAQRLTTVPTAKRDGHRVPAPSRHGMSSGIGVPLQLSTAFAQAVDASREEGAWLWPKETAATLCESRDAAPAVMHRPLSIREQTITLVQTVCHLGLALFASPANTTAGGTDTKVPATTPPVGHSIESCSLIGGTETSSPFPPPSTGHRLGDFEAVLYVQRAVMDACRIARVWNEKKQAIDASVAAASNGRAPPVAPVAGSPRVDATCRVISVAISGLLKAAASASIIGPSSIGLPSRVSPLHAAALSATAPPGDPGQLMTAFPRSESSWCEWSLQAAANIRALSLAPHSFRNVLTQCEFEAGQAWLTWSEDCTTQQDDGSAASNALRRTQRLASALDAFTAFSDLIRQSMAHHEGGGGGGGGRLMRRGGAATGGGDVVDDAFLDYSQLQESLILGEMKRALVSLRLGRTPQPTLDIANGVVSLCDSAISRAMQVARARRPPGLSATAPLEVDDSIVALHDQRQLAAGLVESLRPMAGKPSAQAHRRGGM